MPTKFCHYCRLTKDDMGFKKVPHATNTPRFMCPSCQDMRAKPREELERLAREVTLATNKERKKKK